MASLFKPPESVRVNSKSPKLTLPPIGKKCNIPSLDNSSNIYLSLQTKPVSVDNENQRSLSISISEVSSPVLSSSSDATLVPQHTLNQQPYSASSTISTSSFSKKSRPLPPQLPPLVVTKGLGNQLSNSSGTLTGVSNSLEKLQLNTKSIKSISPSRPHSSKKQTAESSIYLRKEFDTSVESYPSGLISAYDQNSSTNTSPIKSPSPKLETSIDNKEVDQIDEHLWHYSYLKDNIVTLGLLGEGAGGSVAKCKLKNGSKIFALKTINTLNTDPEYQKQIFRELQFNKSFKSDHIVRYFGMFTDEGNSSIYIAMEYMGGKSLDAIYKHLLDLGGRISEKVLGKIAESVLRGLSYLHERKVIHRDIKPQNILLSDCGQVKLCDFGVSGEAVNSLATTFTGTSFYMAPERIQGQPYSVTCDVWSLGLTLLEVAQASFPFGSDKMTVNIAPIELLMLILTFTPALKDDSDLNIVWSKSFKSFIEYCLKKDPSERPSPRQMIKHPWMQGQMKKRVNMEKFINKCWSNE